MQNNKLDILELIEFVRKLTKLKFKDDDQLSYYLRIFFIAFIAGSNKNNNEQMKSIYKAKYLLKQTNMEIQRNNFNFNDLMSLLNNYVIQGNNINDYILDEILVEDDQNFKQLLKEQQQLELLELLEKQTQVQRQQQQNSQENKKINLQTLSEKAKEEQNNQITNKQSQKYSLDFYKQLDQIKQVDQKQVDQIKKVDEKQVQQQQNNSKEKIKNNNDQQLMMIAKKQADQIINKLQDQFQQIQEDKLQSSQIYSSVIVQQKKQKDCKICLSDIDTEFQVLNCLHTFHKECLQQFIQNSNELPIICPMQECKVELLVLEIKQLCTLQKFEQLQQASFNRFVQQNPQIFQCPTPDCQGIYEIVGPSQLCLICKQQFCTKCKKLFHEGICGENSFIRLADRQRFKQCSQCKRWIERNQGCVHITCICGFQFCYECGSGWSLDHICQRQDQNTSLQDIDHNISDPFLQLAQLIRQNRNQQLNEQQKRRLERSLRNVGINFILSAFE